MAFDQVRCTSHLDELHLQGSALSHEACRAVRRTYEPDGLRRLMVFLAPTS